MANDFHPDMRRVLALGVLFCLGTLVGRADQGRFSRSITPSDRTAVGILHLSSDQIAVLDALIRRDEQVHAFPQQGQRQPARFTERLSPEETRNAGLDLLTSAERARLDTLVERYESLGQAEQAAAGTAPGIGLETDPLRPTVHGM
ncbi:MAG TPA: hypothetical protein VNL71_18100, partial [Chloroflexota bacterium]|nr:hypothetical protein [Chloroflexota bacterium]